MTPPTLPPSLRERCLGAVFGCAVGDALGAPFEGLWRADIPEADELLRAYGVFEGYPPGQYTDDTQLTMATLSAIIEQQALSPAAIAAKFADLWRSQAVIGPGGACTQAADRLIAGQSWQQAGADLGQAGNGTAMRMAVLGLCYGSEADTQSLIDVARITHKDPRSIAGGLVVAKAGQLLSRGFEPDDPQYFRACAESIADLSEDLAEALVAMPGQDDSPEQRLRWARCGSTFYEWSEAIVTPFVIPTVLAVFQAMSKHPKSWSGAVAEAIRWGGDTDSLGAIAGALQGLHLGLSSIPKGLVETVQSRDELRLLGCRLEIFLDS